MVSFVPDVVSNGKDKNISLIASWNIVGYSHNDSLNVDDLKFTPATGGTLTWQQAVSQGKVQAYLAYRENDQYKYAAVAALGMDDSALRPGKAYWVKANVAGNLTLPGVGDNTDLSAAYDTLTFEKDGEERLVTDNDIGDWIFSSTGDTAAENIKEYDDNIWFNVCEGYPCLKTTVSTWKGIWIWGREDNINMSTNV